jgi:hypothetical protein
VSTNHFPSAPHFGIFVTQFVDEIVTSTNESAAYRSEAARQFIEGRLRLGMVAFPLSDFQKESKANLLSLIHT